jgi:mono/diheme cytochrome c family protein
MTVPLSRLGDVIDDYCPRCKLLLNHAVASMVDGNVVKVVCQTCHSEHPYKNATVPPKKKAGPRAVLLEQVLAKVAPAVPDPALAGNPPEAGEATEPLKKKRVAAPARYISRHATRPPRGKP